MTSIVENQMCNVRKGFFFHRGIKDFSAQINRYTICRLARCGGVKKIEGVCYEETKEVSNTILGNHQSNSMPYEDIKKLC